MSLVIRPRSPALARLVRSIGYESGPALPSRRERVLPSGDVSLMVNLDEDEFRTYHGPGHLSVRKVGGAMLTGPRTEHTVIDTAEQKAIVTVSFSTAGAAPFFGVPLAETRDQLIELGDLWGRTGAVLRERLLEAGTPAAALRAMETVLLEQIDEPPAYDPAVAYAVAAFERSASVSDVTERLGLLPGRFVRRFRTQLGLTPKRYARVRRLQRVLHEVHGNNAVDWAKVAVAHGYFDQAHLINDFRAMTGITPAAYLAGTGHAPNHVPVPPLAQTPTQTDITPAAHLAGTSHAPNHIPVHP